jgi:D-alanyl-D-alanine dipeptidase
MEDILSSINNYRDHEIDPSLGEGDSLVSLHELGVAGQSYYSRPNRFVPEPDESIEKAPKLRGEVAQKVAEINDALKNSKEVQDYFMSKFGRGVELYVDDSVRPIALQKLLYDIHEPAAIAKNLDKIRPSGLIVIDDEVLNSPRGIAPPSDNPKSPTPHSTGAALDVKFRLIPEPYTQMFSSDKDFIDMGNISGAVDTYRPDFYEKDATDRAEILEKMSPENRQKLIDNWAEYRELRRLFYYVMSALAPNDLHVNPREWWHWSYGDQMHANTEKHLGKYVVAKYGAV